MAEYINSVPFEACLAHIFSFLDLKSRYNCETVCHNWRNVSLKYWSNIKHVTMDRGSFGARPIKAEDYFMNFFKRNSFSLKSIDLSNFCLKMGDSCIMLIGKNCKNLQCADLSGYNKKFSISSIKYFIKNCPQLKSLLFSDITDEKIRWIFCKCNFLEKFEVINNHMFEGTAFTMLPITLTHLSFDRCSMLKTPSLENLNRCINLKYLKIQECGKVSTLVFQHIGKCTSLEELIFARNNSFSMFTEEYEHLSKLSHLKRLTLKRFCNHGDLSTIFNHCPIEYFEVGMFSPYTQDFNIVKYATHLKELVFENDGQFSMSDDVLMMLSCPNLRGIHIRIPGHITNEGVINFIEKCKNLTHACFNSNYCLTNEISSKLIEVALANPNKENYWIINGLCMKPLNDIKLPNNLHIEANTLDDIEAPQLEFQDFYSEYDDIYNGQYDFLDPSNRDEYEFGREFESDDSYSDEEQNFDDEFDFVDPVLFMSHYQSTL